MKIPRLSRSWFFRFPARMSAALLLGTAGGSQGQEALTQALDNPALIWTSGGDLPWQALESADARLGPSVAQLWMSTEGGGPHYGFEFENLESWLETTASGPGVFAVWVRHNNNPYIKLQLSVDGVVAEEISIYGWPEVEEIFSGWQRFTAFLNPGAHRVRFTHRFEPAGTIPISNPKIQLDEAAVLPALGSELLEAAEISAASGAAGEGGAWFPGGGADFLTRGAEGSHDGVDFLLSGSQPQDWQDGNSHAPELRLNTSGLPVTLQWWQRQLSRWNWEPDGEWTRRILFLPPGSRTVTWSGWRLALDQFQGAAAGEVSLSEALDSGDQVFRQTAGIWTGVRTAAAPDGEDAAWTKYPQQGESVLETTIEGPASARFLSSTQSIPQVDWGGTGQSIQASLDGLRLRLSEDGSWSGAVPAGQHVLKWTLPAPSSAAAAGRNAGVLLDDVRISSAAEVGLSEALDSPALTWSQGGDGKTWTGLASALAVDGVDTAVPPLLSPGEISWIETQVNGPGQLRFQWSGVEPPSPYLDPFRGLILTIDGARNVIQNGLQPHPMIELGPGPHTLRWTALGLPEWRPLMLDKLQWTPMDSPPLLAALGNPPLQLFVADETLMSAQPSPDFDNGGSVMLGSTGAGNPFAGSLVPVSSRPGDLQFRWRRSSAAARFSKPESVPGQDFWQDTWLWFESWAQGLVWTVTGLPGGQDSAPAVFLDKVEFYPAAQVSMEGGLTDSGVWRTSPEAPWLGYANEGAWSGAGSPAAPSWIERDIAGPAVVNFAWGLTGLSLRLDGGPPQLLRETGGTRSHWLWIPAGKHVLRWESTSPQAWIGGFYAGVVQDGLVLTKSGDDLLIRVPRPLPESGGGVGLPDSFIQLESSSGGPAGPWTWLPAMVETTSAQSITFRINHPFRDSSRKFYRAAFGPP